MQMKVLTKMVNKVQCEVLTEGSLGSHRHINLPGIEVSLPALTGKDILDVRLGLELQVDFICTVIRYATPAISRKCTRSFRQPDLGPWS